MKPKNKFQKQVVELSSKLPPISNTQIKWAYQNCLEHIGRRTKKGVVTCLECTHTWTERTSEKHCICPKCRIKLMITDTKQRVFHQYEYLCIITAKENFQVVRFFYIKSYAKAGQKACYYHSEVVQRWIATDGNSATLARLRPMGYYVNSWDFGSSMEIRPPNTMHNITPTCIYPRQQLTHQVKRSGYNKQFYDLSPFDLFHFLLSENKAETLLKAGQTKLFQFVAYNTSIKIANYWAALKICMRNGYKIVDASLWCDYIDLLKFFNKDVHNAKYVCPANLNAQHDYYVAKKRIWYDQQQKQEKKAKALEEETLFQELKSKFFGINFTDGLIQVRVLESVQEIMYEGDVMHHCVFANDYHLRPDSLILSAYIEDKRLETIEVSLSQLKILQSRGVCNQNTEYHNQIIKLVNKHIPLIQKRLAA